MENFVFSRPGRDWNEDRGFVCEKFGFVLDGVTGDSEKKYTSFASDAEWYSNRWCEYLKIALNDMSKTILQILEEGLDIITKEYKEVANGKAIKVFPSTTISIVRENGKNLEFYVIADSPIIIKDSFGEVCIFSDTRNVFGDFVENAIIKEVAKKENLGFMQAEKLCQNSLSKNSIVNNFGGHYVVSNNKKALSFGFYKTMPRHLVQRVALMTDGYSQTFDTFKFITPEKLIKKLNTILDSEKIYNKLIKKQLKDKSAKIYARSKITDDATLVVMNF